MAMGEWAILTELSKGKLFLMKGMKDAIAGQIQYGKS